MGTIGYFVGFDTSFPFASVTWEDEWGRAGGRKQEKEKKEEEKKKKKKVEKKNGGSERAAAEEEEEGRREKRGKEPPPIVNAVPISFPRPRSPNPLSPSSF